MTDYMFLIEQIMMDKANDVMNGNLTPIDCILLYKNGYFWVPTHEMEMDKEFFVALTQDIVRVTQPEAYIVISDTYVRDPNTLEIVGEQLFGVKIGRDGSRDMYTRGYERVKKGSREKIVFLSELEHIPNADVRERMTEFYLIDYPMMEDPEDQVNLEKAHWRALEVALKPYPEVTQEKSDQPRRKYEDGPSVH